MSKHLTPVEVCERLIGPIERLALIGGLREKAAYAWRRGSKYRDPGDMPPRANRALLAYAAARGIPLSADHLIWGAPEVEIDRLVDGMRAAPAAQLQRGPAQVAAE
ncbi:MAG: hypothetical protein ACU0A5_08920 [Salipiger marinus]|uniref:hypothetical protein n=1 Tax=Salipiger marinus TaxID=555512 RepID=UPI0040592EBA